MSTMWWNFQNYSLWNTVNEGAAVRTPCKDKFINLNEISSGMNQKIT